MNNWNMQFEIFYFENQDYDVESDFPSLIRIDAETETDARKIFDGMDIGFIYSIEQVV